MDYSTPSFPVLHYESLLRLTSIELMMPSNHLILSPPSPPALNLFQHQGLFQWVGSSSDGWSVGIFASASVLPMDIQVWFPLGFTGLMSLLSKGLSSIFTSTRVRKHQFFDAQPSLWSNSHIPPYKAKIIIIWLFTRSILCRPLLLLPSIFPTIRVFSNDLALWIRWPKYWSFSFSTSPYSGLVSFRIDWFDLKKCYHQELERETTLGRELFWWCGRWVWRWEEVECRKTSWEAVAIPALSSLPTKKKSLVAWAGSGSEEDEQVPADWGSGCGVTQQTSEAPVLGSYVPAVQWERPGEGGFGTWVWGEDTH